jgi:integrase
LDELKKDTDTPQWTEDDLRNWLSDDRGKAVTTTDDRLRHLRFMETYPGQPVMLHGTRYQFVLSGRLYYAVRKDQDPGYGALQKDLKCLKTVGGFLGLPRDIWPVAPPSPQGTSKWVPTPEQVYGLLHADYARDPKRSVVNAWVRHVLAVEFGVGMRPPKEVWFMKADAYNADTGLLTVIEPKKRHRARTLYVEPTWLAHSRRNLSLSGWLAWRRKLDPTSDAMFPNPETGRDFPSPEAFNAYLNRLVQPKFPWFHGYLARHWCCYARIIAGGFTDTSYNLVAEWLGHESVDMTRDTYGPAARAYAKSPQYGTNWLSRAFRKPRGPRARNGDVPLKAQKTA